MSDVIKQIEEAKDRIGNSQYVEQGMGRSHVNVGRLETFHASTILTALSVLQKMASGDNEHLIDELDVVIGDTHELDIRDRDYAVAVTEYLAKHIEMLMEQEMNDDR